jgi:type I restriction enzyme, S subunit
VKAATHTTTLGEILASADSGFASGDNLQNGVAQLRMNNVTRAGTLDWSAIRRVPADVRKIEKYSLRPGDIVFNSTNSPDLVGKTALFHGFNEPVLFSNHFLRLRVDGKCAEPGFIAFWLNRCWLHRTFENLATRWVNQASVRKDDLLELRIPLPVLSEQKRIARLLEQADRLRHTRRYALELSDTFLPGVFLKLFGDPGMNPKKFPLKQVETLFSETRDGVKCGPFGSALKKHEYVSEGIPVWTVDCVGENEFHEDNCLYITPAKYDELSAYSAENNDILVSRAGTVGRMSIVQTNHPRSIIHSNLIRLSLDPTKCQPIFFVTLMTHFASSVGRLKRGQEGAYTFMSTSSLPELQIPSPPPELQTRFAELVERHERLRAKQREALRQAEHLFQALLQEAFGDKNNRSTSAEN